MKLVSLRLPSSKMSCFLKQECSERFVQVGLLEANTIILTEFALNLGIFDEIFF